MSVVVSGELVAAVHRITGFIMVFDSRTSQVISQTPPLDGPIICSRAASQTRDGCVFSSQEI
jgi:hypothetical protein